ncbi:MAG: hypothetical protein Kow0025_10300 [Thermodesulfovibrionales bacterium]
MSGSFLNLKPSPPSPAPETAGLRSNKTNAKNAPKVLAILNVRHYITPPVNKQKARLKPARAHAREGRGM